MFGCHSRTEKTEMAIVHPIAIFRKGFALMMQGDGYIFNISCNTPAELMADLPLHPATNIVFLSPKPSVPTMQETIAWLTEKFPPIKIIVVGFSESKQEVETITNMGAQGYLSAEAEPRHVRLAIKAVSKGKKYFLLSSAEFRRLLTPIEIEQIMARVERKK